MKILVVDDSSIMRRIICKALDQGGFDDIIEAGNGAEALERLEGVDLVLTDWNMPVMNGLTFVQEMRKMSAYDEVPIIMVTAEGAESEVVRALQYGVSDFIVKPFTTLTILRKVKELLER